MRLRDIPSKFNDFVKQFHSMRLTLYSYECCLMYFVQRRGPMAECPYFADSPATRVHIYSLAKTLHLFSQRHYRDSSFGEDIRKNLKNVAVPGTGVALSIFFHNIVTALLFIFVLYPALCLIAAVFQTFYNHSSPRVRRRSYPPPASELFAEYLLDPQHWFALWRLNCVLVAWHARQTGSRAYGMEDKGTFLLAGEAAGVPVSPFLRCGEGGLVVKHKSIEGGMGIHFFSDFSAGGDWIIQKRLSNSNFLSRLLPPDAPLSTLRVITSSTNWLRRVEGNRLAGQEGTAWRDTLVGQGGTAWRDGAANSLPTTADGMVDWSRRVDGEHAPGGNTRRRDGGRASGTATARRPPQQQQHELPQPPPHARARHLRSAGTSSGGVQEGGTSRSLAAEPVFGMAGEGDWRMAGGSGRDAAPDGWEATFGGRDAMDGIGVMTVMFRAGRAGAATDHNCVCFDVDSEQGTLRPGVSNQHWYRLGRRAVLDFSGIAPRAVHARHPDTGVMVTGHVIPHFAEIVRVCREAHARLLPEVPLVGWDAALTPDGTFLLELNISCNFFEGTYDRDAYIGFMSRFFEALERSNV